MQIAIIHFHLNRGGVTQVIGNQLRALDAVCDEPARVSLFYGGRRKGFDTGSVERLEKIDVSLHELPELEYNSTKPNPDRLYDKLRRAFVEMGYTPDKSVLHVHNHSLGKNVSVPGALARAAADGYPLLLQIHDFAEDFRPGSYRTMLDVLADSDHEQLSSALYPQAAQIHYAVLNRRDFQALTEAGVSDERLHLLPNATGGIDGLIPRPLAKQQLFEKLGLTDNVKYILYPVRGIRRKNLGEALLWSALGGHQVCVGITLPPLNPVEQESYARWKGFAAEIASNCLFETGGSEGLEFGVNLSAADRMLTTSVAEGFGMVFLESWLAERRLVGRDLPEITSDFKRSGIDLTDLYPRLHVPIDWIDQAHWKSSLESAYTSTQRDFGVDADFQQAFEMQKSRLIQDGHVDFAQLDSLLQRQVIQTVHNDERRREALLELNPSIERALSAPRDDGLIEGNAAAVRDNYSESMSGKKLRSIYERLTAGPRDTTLCPPSDGRAILNSFLELSRLHPIRLET